MSFQHIPHQIELENLLRGPPQPKCRLLSYLPYCSYCADTYPMLTYRIEDVPADAIKCEVSAKPKPPMLEHFDIVVGLVSPS